MRKCAILNKTYVYADMLHIDDFLKALSDPSRLRILSLLSFNDSLCVCELVDALDTHQPQVSRHLAQLRAQDIVIGERRGKWVDYRLHPSLPDWAREILYSATQAGEITGASRVACD